MTNGSLDDLWREFREWMGKYARFHDGMVGSEDFPGGRIGRLEKRMDDFQKKLEAIPAEIVDKLSQQRGTTAVSIQRRVIEFGLGIAGFVLAAVIIAHLGSTK